MMKKYSFKKYITQNYENDLFETVNTYIVDNFSDIHLWSNNIDVENLDEENISFDDMTVEYVFVNGDTKTNDIEFDVIVSGQIYFMQFDRHNDYDDSCIVWFRINCSAEIDSKLKNFKINDVETYDRKMNRFHKKLSDGFVPIISKDNADEEAEEFLKQFCPEALITPQKIDPLATANKMGLNVIKYQITEECSIFGQIFFHDSIINDQTIKAGSILIDPRVEEIRGLGGLNNTIIHECVHWYKHKLAFELVRLYNPELSNIATQAEEVQAESSNEMSPTDWMEMHARTIAPKILMPKNMVYQAIEMVQRDFSKNGVSILDSTEKTIEYLSEYFGVSKLAAKIRMVELGYEDAIGAFNYVDGKYVPTHRWKKGSLKVDETYTLGLIDATIQATTNPIIQTSGFVFVESHLCLNSAKYVEVDIFGKTRLTDYARNHMDECCLKFSVSINTRNRDQDYIFKCILNRDERSGLTFNLAFDKNSNLSKLEQAKQLVKDQLGLKETMNAIATLTFGQALTHLMKIPPKLSNEKLAEYTGLSDKTISRMRKDEGTTIQSVVAVCIGLQLHPKLSTLMLEKLGYVLGPPNDLHMIYNTILLNCYTQTIDECNELLINAGFEALTAS